MSEHHLMWLRLLQGRGMRSEVKRRLHSALRRRVQLPVSLHTLKLQECGGHISKQVEDLPFFKTRNTASALKKKKKKGPTLFNESLRSWLVNEFLPGAQLLLNAPYCS